MVALKTGIVIIGRNVAASLAACLEAIPKIGFPLVYVDSDSQDGSLKIADQENIPSISLHPPSLNAARARNAGYKALLKQHPDLQVIQFVDGDTILASSWIVDGLKYLHDKAEAAIVSGILREKNRDSSLYKRFFDMEWEQPIGEIASTGGNCLVRVAALKQVDGFDETIVGGEDSDLGYRLRHKGWKIFHLPIAMGMHDSNIQCFSQLLKRMMRAGACFQQISKKERLFFRENLSNWILGGILPLLILLSLPWTYWGLLLLAAYPLLFLKISLQLKKEWPLSDRLLYASFCVLSKFPGFIGACKYLTRGSNGS